MVTQTARTDPLSKIFSALAHPIRREILVRLKQGKATVSELAEPYDMSLPAITRHLKVLDDAGLVEKKTVAQTREVHLLEPTPIFDWMDDFEVYWTEHFGRLQEYLDNESKANKESKKNE